MTPTDWEQRQFDIASGLEMDRRADAKMLAAAPVILSALMEVIEATRAYLPPDGISGPDLINKVLEATDNPQICAALKSIGAL